MGSYRDDPEHIAPARRAARCQHVKTSGERCAAPARRGRRFCRFHGRPRRHFAGPAPSGFDYIEDATGLQDAIMQVLHQIHDKNPDHKACGLSLYALQLAGMNLKNFMEERTTVAENDPEDITLREYLTRELEECRKRVAALAPRAANPAAAGLLRRAVGRSHICHRRADVGHPQTVT